MANEVLQKSGQQIVWADHAGDFSPATASDLRDGSGSYTNVQLSLTNVADAAARQGAQADYGATRAGAYHLKSALEWLTTGPTSGDVVEFYMAWSHKSGEGWPGGVSDGDAAYTGTTDTLANSVKQLDYIGSHVCTDDLDTDGVQVADVGIFTAKARYGVLVVKNESGFVLNSTDDIEMHIVATPIIDEVQ